MTLSYLENVLDDTDKATANVSSKGASLRVAHDATPGQVALYSKWHNMTVCPVRVGNDHRSS